MATVIMKRLWECNGGKTTMEISLLGSLEIRENGKSIVPTAGKPRQILALLALHRGRTIQAATLMEELWDQNIPRSATTTLQTYILQLRTKISAAQPADGGQSPKDLLRTAFGGYLLRGGQEKSDVLDFERQARVGATAYEAGDYAAASAVLARSLELWRGYPLEDVPVGPVLAREVMGMEESRMHVLEQRINADLQLGRHAYLLPELRVLVAEHPLHEGFCAQFMLALYRTNSAWRALATFQQLRATLISELGIEPSARLRRLHQAVLADDPALNLDTASRVDADMRLIC